LEIADLRQPRQQLLEPVRHARRVGRRRDPVATAARGGNGLLVPPGKRSIILFTVPPYRPARPRRPRPATLR
jgi:hypothetical protein